jgi:very-short-patch-repair endonuclease
MRAPLSRIAGEGPGEGDTVNARDARRYLRREQTSAEARLWAALRRGQLGGLHFRRQHNIGAFITDFCCLEARLVVEVDGAVHRQAAQIAHDRDRDVALAEAGYLTLRFTNDDVLCRLREVLARIQAAAEGRTTEADQ